MGSFSAYLGKGLSEPCPPYRTANVFGAPLNTPNAGGWNCLPNIVGSTTRFDLSGIPDNHEVCVALATIQDTRQGEYSFRFAFYKDTPFKKLFDYTFRYGTVQGGWIYAYAYIGRTPWEINEDGDYFVNIAVGGPESFSREIDFTVTGIAVPQPAPPVPSAFMAAIVTALNTVSSLFYSAYVETYYWAWPFNYLATPFYYGSMAFSQLAWRFSDFGAWVNDVSSKIGNYLSWDTIWSYILSYVPNLATIRDWFYNWVTNVNNTVSSWWSATSVTVQGWISAAVQPFNAMLTAWSNFWNSTWPGWVSSFYTLKSAWDNFWQYTLPGLVSFTWLATWWNERLLDVQGLINSAFLARAGFWEGWQDMKNNVVEFFADPLGWLESRFAVWFLGPEG